MDKFLFDRNMKKDTYPQKALGLFNQKGCTVELYIKDTQGNLKCVLYEQIKIY